MTRKIGLDAVRACAICLVLIAHFAKSLEACGFYGVELFFALSGFLIGGILHRSLAVSRPWSFADVWIFWLRRWWRTLPNYYLFLVVSLVFHFYFGGLPTLRGLAPFLIFSQSLFGAGLPFYAVSWSLCVEEWFYFLFPLCLLLFVCVRFSTRSAFVCSTLLFLVVPPLVREVLFGKYDPTVIRMMTIPRLDALFYGVALSFVVARYRLVPSAKVALFLAGSAGLVTLVVGEHFCVRTNALVWFYRVAFVAVPFCCSLLLPWCATFEQLPQRWLCLGPPITKLSLWSYSIYLSHIPILFATYAAFGPARDHVVVNALSKIVGLILCLAVSRTVFAYFESRLMRFRPAERTAAKA